MLYFAYGSNMNWEQIRKRCPSARFLGVAAMRNQRIAFTRKSTKRCCGVADVVPENGRTVWGVVYEICDHDIGALDFSEGYRPNRNENSYWRRECMVFLDNDDKQPLTVHTYFAEHQQNPPCPNAEYMELILSGARYWHLPQEYIHELQQMEVSN